MYLYEFSFNLMKDYVNVDILTLVFFTDLSYESNNL